MSGTSLDGLDLACCRFTPSGSGWKFELKAAETVVYPQEWKAGLSELFRAGASKLAQAHADYGRYLGERCNKFILENQLEVDLIASHGHTIFHQPQLGFTTQVGSGAQIHAVTGLPVACNFRELDVALGGQGAPLVPIGDRDLFGEYGACVNLGGFANISYDERGKRVAFDISPCNLVLNEVARKMGYEYDDRGQLAARGTVDQTLLGRLDSIPFYAAAGARSLGTEWLENEFNLVVRQSGELEQADLLATLTEHIARQVVRAITQSRAAKVLVTGGGAHNHFLVARVRQLGKAELVIPPDEVINFKEAIIFGYLGLLRFQKQVNCLASVTGAMRDSCSGELYGG
jgi:anhydro-N-acetylmuramic acid kinase